MRCSEFARCMGNGSRRLDLFCHRFSVLFILSHIVCASVAGVCCRMLVNLFQIFKPLDDVLVFVCLCQWCESLRQPLHPTLCGVCQSCQVLV